VTGLRSSRSTGMTMKEHRRVLHCGNRSFYPGPEGVAGHTYAVIYWRHPVSATVETPGASKWGIPGNMS
jgi:hypothetical protein